MQTTAEPNWTGPRATEALQEWVAAPRARASLLALILVLYFALGLGYAWRTPPWNNPDEPAHYNYVAHIVQTGTLPIASEQTLPDGAVSRLIGLHFPRTERIDFIHHQDWQPPLYYLAAAPLLVAVRGEDQIAQLHALRALGVAMGGLTLLAAYAAAREVFVCAVSPRSDCRRTRAEGEWLALAACATIAGIPMFTAIMAAASNDTLTALLGAVVTWLLLRVMRTGVSTRAAALLGVLLALGVMTKLTLLALVPIVLVGILCAAFQRGEPPRTATRHLAVCALAAGVVLAPWLVHQGLSYGWDDLLGTKRQKKLFGYTSAFPFGPDDIAGWIRTLVHSFWGLFGWMNVPLPNPVYVAWDVLTQATVLGGAVLVARHAKRLFPSKSGDLRPLLAGLSILATLVGVVYLNLTVVSAQGRYLFAALAPLAMLLVASWRSLIPGTHRTLGVVGVSFGLVAFNAYVLLALLEPAFAL